MFDPSEYVDETDALLTAALIGDFETAKSLLEGGVDPNQQNELGQNALMIAILEGGGSGGGFYWADLFVKFGGNIDHLDNDGDSALDLAIFRRENETAQFLRAQGAIGKTGPSAKQLVEDEIYQGFADANAIKRFISMTDRKKRPSSE